jgi:DNA-binding ferritin-like protein
MIGQGRVRVKEFSQKASVQPAEITDNVRAMIAEADTNALIVIQEMREAIKNARSVDPASASILKRFLKIHEKHQWWLHYILDKRQGLSK